jgi:hypothetical protein
MKPIRFLSFLLVALFITACKGPANKPITTASIQPVDTISAPTKRVPSEALQASVADSLKSFSVPPDSQMDSGSSISNDPDATSGSFRILSSADLATVVKFYETELPKQGWLLRYTDPNFPCGVRQYWKNDTIYLLLIFGYEDSSLYIDVQYKRVDAQSLNKYLADFPLPESSELVYSSATSWEFYVLQDYKAVEAFYKQKLLDLNWAANGVLPQVEASCGDDDPDCGGGGGGCPSGAGLLPTPTFDLRQKISLLYIMPDTNEVQIDIIPHGDATRLYVSLTMKALSSVGLPDDVPIYTGAVLLMATPGTVEYTIDASVETVMAFYMRTLQEAGWAADGAVVETPGMSIQNWSKGSQKLTVMITPYEDGSMLVLDCSTCR